MLSDYLQTGLMNGSALSLNAPSGAGCFLTLGGIMDAFLVVSLNAPSGAGCFLTHVKVPANEFIIVLMHLLVLGAF